MTLVISREKSLCLVKKWTYAMLFPHWTTWKASTIAAATLIEKKQCSLL